MDFNETLAYYNAHGEEFSAATQEADFSEIQNFFLEFVPEGGKILDLGCGAGRDAKAFLSKGYQVDAVDGSAVLCQKASLFTGIPVRQMLFEELCAEEMYDGIWACASILHLPYEQLPDMFLKIVTALRPGGVFYTSFKYGEFEGERGGRYFTDMTARKAEALLAQIEGITLKEAWITGDVRKEKAEEQWLNLILIKTCQNQK